MLTKELSQRVHLVLVRSGWGLSGLVFNERTVLTDNAIDYHTFFNLHKAMAVQRASPDFDTSFAM